MTLRQRTIEAQTEAICADAEALLEDLIALLRGKRFPVTSLALVFALAEVGAEVNMPTALTDEWATRLCQLFRTLLIPAETTLQ
jgi:hypothetical protein